MTLKMSFNCYFYVVFLAVKNIKVTVEWHFKGMLNLGDTQNLTIAKMIRKQEPFRMFNLADT